ncbi:30S ribosomal protein S9 [Candidatus Woesearchaeota archaeon]|nr:30S ribosomal protein S9 [Candidatus Woesearchaeota archaeon]
MVKIIQTSGRRKTAIARATLQAGTGVVRFNNQVIDFIEPKLLRLKLQEPLFFAKKVADKLNISIKTHGGGYLGQIEAARLAMARGLVVYDKKLEKTFLDYDRHLLVADIRRKEQRKPNDSKARAKRQKSYR